jgi:hypothetical protein
MKTIRFNLKKKTLSFGPQWPIIRQYRCTKQLLGHHYRELRCCHQCMMYGGEYAHKCWSNIYIGVCHTWLSLYDQQLQSNEWYTTFF